MEFGVCFTDPFCLQLNTFASETETMIIHIHFHSHRTGVTRSVETLIPVMNKYTEARVFGYGIDCPKTGFTALLRQVYSGGGTVIHAHRNNEMLFAILLRLLRAKFRLIFTRHSDTSPSGFTVWLMKKADMVISLNPGMAETLPCRNTMIPHGVDTELFSPGERTGIQGIKQNYLVSVVGRIRPSKGQLVAMKAISGLLEKNRELGLMLIGKVDNAGYADEIREIALRNKIESQVHFIPETNDIVRYYRASSVVIIPSVSEGFSLVCLEAMACGVITVATGATGIHDSVIQHGLNGYLFPVDDVAALSRILSDVVSGNSLPDREVIRKTILDKWSVDNNVRELLKVYSNI